MDYRLDASCGLYCGACPVLIANKNGTLEEAAKQWNATPEQLVCHGCKSDAVCSFCTECHFKKCSSEKGIEFCFECGDFPCEKLTAFRNDEYPHHSIIFKNLDEIRTVGVAHWLTLQKERWSCLECDTEFAWYSDTCRKCGAPVFNSKSEEHTISRSSEN